jgi:hypothetical protein
MDTKTKPKRSELYKKAKQLGYTGDYRTSTSRDLLSFINQKQQNKKRKRTDSKERKEEKDGK